jgi:hypothetical protein
MNNPKPLTMKFLGVLCTVHFEEYENGKTAITLNVKKNGEPFAVATVNIPFFPLEKDEVIIKNYGENHGILDALLKAGIVSKPIRQAQAGFVTADVCKLLCTLPNSSTRS